MPALLAQQSAIALFEKLNPQTSVYHNLYALKLHPAVNTAKLKKSLAILQKRHKILSSGLIETEDNFTFEVLKNVSLPFETFRTNNLSQMVNSEGQFVLFDDLSRINRPFKYHREPLWRAAILSDRKNPNERYFLFNHHEVLFDRQSLDILLDELNTIYENPSLNEEITINAPSDPSAQEGLNEITEKARLQYWQEKLQLLHTLAFRHSYKENKNTPYPYRGDRHYFNIPDNLLKEIPADSNRIEEILFTALFITLNQIAQDNDICLGWLANVRKPNDHSIGMYRHSLPIRLTIDANENFSSLTEKLKCTLQEAENHQLPINTITQKALEVTKKNSSNVASPFTVMYSFSESEPKKSPSLFTSAPSQLNLQHCRFENFGLSFHKINNQISGYIEFNTTIFQKREIELIAERYLSVLGTLIRTPQKQLKNVSLLLPQEKKILQQFEQQNIRPTPQNETLMSQYTRALKKSPNHTAVVFHDRNNVIQKITYKELDQEVTKLATYLQFLGIQPNQYVGVSIERSPELIIATLAVFKAGGTLVPLESAKDTKNQTRIEYRIKDTDLNIVLCDQHTKPFFENKKDIVTVNVSDKNQTKVTEYLKKNFRIPCVTPHDLAYVIYTSGTTGEPKGVMIEHKSLTNLTYAVLDRHLTGDVLCNAPNTFDCFYWEILEWLSTEGCALHIINENERLSSHKQEQVIKTHDIACATLLPILLDNLEPQHLPSLKDIISMGAVPHEATLKKWYELGRTIRNEYGPTEACVCSTQNTYKPFIPFTSIGTPIRNAKIVILDENLRLCPIGLSGRIYIGGQGIARGYLNQPELTQRAFPKVIFNSDKDGYDRADDNDMDAETLYDTGDLGCLLLNNSQEVQIDLPVIDFLGRADRQIKLDGFRIELDGVENIIRKHPSIQDVYLKPDINEHFLIAYIIPEFDKQISEEEVHNYLKTTTVPAVAYPKSVIHLDEFPLTNNGKIDHKKLPLPTFEKPNDRKPETLLHKQLAEIWTKVLGYSINATNRTFAQLGGTSIVVPTLEILLRKEFRIPEQISITINREKMTIEKLAIKLQKILKFSQDQNKKNPAPHPIRPYNPLPPPCINRKGLLPSNEETTEDIQDSTNNRLLR